MSIPRQLAALLVAVATALVIVGAALLLLMSPLYMHPALAQSGSASILGVDESAVEHLSDQTVGELFTGPGTFAFLYQPPCGQPAVGPGASTGTTAAPCSGDGIPFYDAAEIAHLQDVRVVLFGFLAFVAASLVILVAALLAARRAAWPWRAVSRGGAAVAIAAVAIGLLFTVAFEPMFVLFHEIFFPQGDWSFDTATERLVQLYPTPFWELTATCLALLVIAGGIVAWWLARRLAAPRVAP